MKFKNRFSFFLVLSLHFLISFSCFSQKNTTIDKDIVNENEKNFFLNKPTKAALLSALIPGIGQVYNKKYWKIPILYGGMVTFAIVYNFNNKRYRFFRDNLIYSIDNNPDTTVDPLYVNVDLNGFKRARDYHRRYRDMTVIISFLLYGWNIVDAAVDAHLMEFNVDEDITVSIKPKLINNNFNKAVPGISLTLSLGDK